MTRIRRMCLSVDEKKEWISLVSGSAPNTLRVIPAEGDEFEFSPNDDEPLETQISRLMKNRTAETAS
ncbi:MAG: hypothetical protein ACR2QQ_09960 [Gammaproteobacteria bacterium]